MTSKHTVGDAIRMIGQLLLHHPTTEYYARDKDGKMCDSFAPAAFCFCYLGALRAVIQRLNVGYWAVNDTIGVLIWGTQDYMDATKWDGGSDLDRRSWAQKMADYNG